MSESVSHPQNETSRKENDLKEISAALKAIEKKVLENRSRFDDSLETIKDFRRIFDQDSSRMNQAIFNDAPSEEIRLETLRTISVLIEILSRAKKNKT